MFELKSAFSPRILLKIRLEETPITNRRSLAKYGKNMTCIVEINTVTCLKVKAFHV